MIFKQYGHYRNLCYFYNSTNLRYKLQRFLRRQSQTEVLRPSLAVSFFSVYSFSGRIEKSGLRPTGNGHMCQNELHCLRVAVLFSRKTHIIHDTRR